MKLVDFTHLENWHMKVVSKTMSAIWPLLDTRVVNFNDRNIQLISMRSLLRSKTERVELRVGATATTEYPGYITKGTESYYLQKSCNYHSKSGWVFEAMFKLNWITLHADTRSYTNVVHIWTPIRYKTLHWRDQSRAALLCYRNHAKINILMWEKKSYMYQVWFSCPRKSYPE